MKKQVKKWLTFAMALMLILGSINYNPLFANATARDEAEYDDSVTDGDADGIITDNTGSVSGGDDTVSGGDVPKLGKGQRLSVVRNARESAEPGTYSFGSLTQYTANGNYGHETTITDAGEMSIKYKQQYAEIRFNVPGDIEAGSITKVTVNGITGDTSHLAIKLVDADGNAIKDANGNDLVKYGTTTIDVPSDKADQLAVIGIMYKDAVAADTTEDYVMTSVTFTVPEKQIEVEPIVYKFGDLTQYTASGNYGHETIITDAGEMSIKYKQQYAEIRFNLPDDIVTGTVTNVTVGGITGDASHLAIKLIGADGNTIKGADGNDLVNYGSATIDVPSDKADQLAAIGIMYKDSVAADTTEDYVMANIVFTAQKEQEEATTRYYTFNDVTENGGYGNTSTVSDAGVLNISYESQYSEKMYNLPEGVDGTSVTAITFKVSEGDVSNLAIKVYADGTQTDVKYGTDTITVEGDLSAASAVTFGLMNNGASASDFVIDYFSITAVQTGGLETPPEAEQEEATTRYYTFNDVTENGGYGNTSTVSDAGVLNISYESQYSEKMYNLPEGVDGTSVTAITFKVSEGDVSNLAIKVYADGTQTDVKYGTDTITVEGDLSAATTVTFGLMNNGASASDFVIDYFSITAVQTGGLETPPEAEPEEATTRYYTFNDVTENGGYGNTSTVSDAGVLNISYESQYSEKMYNLPEGVDGTSVTAITFKVSEGDVSNLAIKVYADGTQTDVKYGTDTITVEGDLSAASAVTFGLMNNGASASDFVIDYFSITAVQTGGLETPPEAEPTEPEEATTRYYTFNDVTENGGYGNTSTVSDAGVLNISYESQYSEKMYNLPEGVDGTSISAITFKVSEGDVSNLAIKVYADGTQTDVKYGTDTITVEGDLSAATAVTFGLMNNGASASDFVIDYFSITAVQTGGLETPPEAEPEEPAETYTITVNASALKHDWSQTGITYALGADNRLKIDFGVQNQDSRYDLTNGQGEALSIDLANVEKVTFNVCDQDGRHNISLSKDGAKAGDPISNQLGTSFVMVPTAKTGTINEVVFQAAGWDYSSSNTLTVESVVFTMKKTADDQEDISYGEAPTEIVVDPTENITPEIKSDIDKRFTHKEGGLTPQDATRCTPKEVEKVELSFGGAWDTISFDLPEAIDLAKCKSVVFAISEQTVPVTLKLFDEEGNEIGDFTQYDVNKQQTTIAFSGRTEKVASVGIMLHSKHADEAIRTCVFDGVLFEMMEEALVTHSLTYTCSDLTVVESKNGGSCEKVDGKYVLTFPGLNAETSFKLPKIINMENCVSVEFTVTGQTGPVNYYLDFNGSAKQSAYYNTPGENGNAVHKITVTTTEGVNEVRIQCGGEEYTPNSGITLENVTFIMKGSDESNDFLNEEDTTPDKVEGTPNKTPSGEYSYQAGSSAVRVSTAGVPGIEYVPTTTNQYQITFVSQYNELRLTLPEAINLLQCKSVTFAVSAQSGPVAFRLYNEDAQEIRSMYNQQNKDGSPLYTYELSSTEKVKYVGILLDQNNPGTTCTFDGVVFDVDSGADTETYTVTYPAHELTLKNSAAMSCELQNGNWMIKFSDKEQNVNFKLPETVNLEKCVNIIFTVKTQNGPVNFNVSMDSSKLKDYWYNTGKTVYTLEPGITNKINEVGIQSGGEGDNGENFVPGSFIELVSVSFLMKGSEPKPAPADDNYTMDFFEIDSQSAGVTQTVNEKGAATITFPKKGNSITYVIPDTVDTNHMTSINFLKSLSGVKVELLNEKGKVLFSGTDSTILTNCNPEVRYIRLTSLADNTVLTLDSVKFNIDPDAFEAIVLNGDFAREDVSMWGAALWGDATVTAKTSDTLIGDIYSTYGEITNRESPYHCFAQDVTDRTVPGTGYKFSFWAKLSDDYKDAPVSQRVIEFSPYYLDANGKEVYTMTRTGVYLGALEPGEWSHFSGVVGLPQGATGFVIRIVEQGTNYGQGECIKGSYAVTGVTLTPTDYPPEPRWGGGGSGNRSNTVTKEATCEVTYALNDLAIDWASATAKSSGNNLNVSFTNNYDEVRLKLPRTLDMSTCAWIKVSIPAQNVPIAIKLYRKGQQVDVAYYNDITTSYLMVPIYDGLIDAIGIMSLATPNPAGAYALADCITFGLTEEPAPEEKSNSIVINGDFADEDMSDWSAALWGDGVTITQHTSSTPIFGNTYTYATYSRRTSPYQCFAQDITDRVEQNETYTFSFWAKLSNDYKGAPENQRVVQFAPYTVDKSGKENYNPRLEGNYLQVLEPGVWTYFEGTYKVTHDNPIAKVVIRILEQGTNYGQGECVKGSFSVAGVHMERYIPEPPSIDEDVPNLKDATAEVFGDDFIMGTAVTVNEMEDIGIEMLVNKHFNAVTIGNELKPDALFNYSNDEHTPLQTITFNGEKLEVPTLYYGRAEEILDTLKKWNEGHPDDPIKVRGHVLVWHSQTPEWFFREGYTVGQNADGSENYVTPEVMNLRLEWYIKTVLEHFTGEDSPYKDMFYGWDVVNEAVSNGGTGYRTEKIAVGEPLSQSTHSSNSSWWAVYQSNEFIIKAFQFANQYAPADVELYYNDYNEADNKKMAGIVKLLRDVKEADGTRIDGMGMQGHYNMFNPSVSDIERAIRAYAEIVGKVMFTEFDMKASGDISKEESREKEYLAQGKRYHDIYEMLKKLDAEDGIEIGGFTAWGTVDKYSWLQNSSDVGGGSDGTLTQCPLFFDADYKVKPSYWAFVDYTVVDPDWMEESEEEETKQEPEEIPDETPEETETPETQPETEPVVDTQPVVKEQKNSPVAIIAIAVGAVVVGAGAGAGFYFSRKKKKSSK